MTLPLNKENFIQEISKFCSESDISLLKERGLIVFGKHFPEKRKQIEELEKANSWQYSVGVLYDDYDENGFNRYFLHKDTNTIYDPQGFDIFGWSENGTNKDTGTLFDEQGYDIHGYDKDGYTYAGWNKEGINKETKTERDKDGYDKDGWSTKGICKWTHTRWDKNGYDMYGNLKVEDNADDNVRNVMNGGNRRVRFMRM